MHFLKKAGRISVYLLFFICVYILAFIFFGILGSLYWDGVDENVGAFYGFTMLLIPPLVGAIATFAFRNKWKEQQVKKSIDSLPVSVPMVVAQPSVNTAALPNRSFACTSEIGLVDLMEGHEFEQWCADLLRENCFSNVEVTRGSGDQGVDILAEKDGVKYAIQCKCYTSNLGNTPVQEVCAGKKFYHCHIGVVLTNRYFTPGAKELAEATGTLLWDRDWIIEHLPVNEALPIGSRQSSTVDEMFISSIAVVLETGQASVSMLQRRLKLGYAHAARLMDQMEEFGIVGPYQGSKPRDILVTQAQWERIYSQFSR